MAGTWFPFINNHLANDLALISLFGKGNTLYEMIRIRGRDEVKVAGDAMIRIVISVIGLLVLCRVSACSPYQRVQVSDEPRVAEVGEVVVERLEIGDQVRISTIEGNSFSGHVSSISEETIIIVARGENSQEKVAIKRNEITKLEVKVGHKTDVLLYVGVLVAFFAVVASSVNIMGY